MPAIYVSFLLARNLTADRELASRMADVRYGQILPICTACGAWQSSPEVVDRDEGLLNYRLDDEP